MQAVDEQEGVMHESKHRAATLSVSGKYTGVDKENLPAQQGESLQVLTPSGEAEMQTDDGHSDQLSKAADHEEKLLAMLTTAVLAGLVVVRTDGIGH